MNTSGRRWEVLLLIGLTVNSTQKAMKNDDSLEKRLGLERLLLPSGSLCVKLKKKVEHFIF
jgi:hypothetical protein